MSAQVLSITRDITERKRAEETSARSEASYRTLFDSVNDGIFIHDAETGAILDVNTKTCELYGYSREEFRYVSIDDISSGERPFVQQSAAYLIRLAAAGVPQLFEWHCRDKNGKLFWGEVNLKDAIIWGRKCVLAMVRDITERKKAEEERLAYLRFLENLDKIDGVIRTAVSHEEMMRDVLEMVRSIFGCDRAWLLYPCDPDAPFFRVPMESTHPDYPGALDQDLDVRMDNGVAEDFRIILETDGPLTHKVGSKNTIFVRAAREFGVKSIMYMAIHPKVGKPWLFGMHQCSHERDWTDSEKRLFQEIGVRITHALSTLLFLRDLGASENRYRALFQESADAVIIVTPDGEIIDANPAGRDLFGVDMDDIIGVSIREFSSNPSEYDDLTTEIRDKGFVKDRPLTINNRSGTQRICLLGSSVWKDDQGSIKGYISVIKDITEKRLFEEQLIQSQKMEAVGALAGGIAHDINNLLQVVLGHADILLLRDGIDAKARKAVEAIHNAAQNGAKLVKRILTFSRKAKAEMRPVNLSDEVRRVRELLRRTIPRMIDIEMHLEEDLSPIQADPSQLEQVLLNLAVNAKDAMPDGGKLVFETMSPVLDEANRRTLPALVPGPYVLLKVTDSGHGMDKPISDRIFEPFFTTKGPGEGTGLGLSTVFGIVKGHGGGISCHSAVGVGTSFEIYFPVKEAASSDYVYTTVEMPAGGPKPCCSSMMMKPYDLSALRCWRRPVIPC